MEISELVKCQRTYFQSHASIDINYRLSMLKKLKYTIIKYESRIHYSCIDLTHH